VLPRQAKLGLAAGPSPPHDSLPAPSFAGSYGTRGAPGAEGLSEEAIARMAQAAGLLQGHTPGLQQDGQFTFDVVLQMPEGARLGIDVTTDTVTEFSGLTVKRISKGCVVDDWNQSQRECHRVCPGDCIVSVNGVSGDFAHMWEELRARSRRDLRMTILRRSGQQPLMQHPGLQGPAPITLPGQGGFGKGGAGRAAALTDGSGSGPGGSSMADGMGQFGPPAILNLPKQSMMSRGGAEPSRGGLVQQWGAPGMDFAPPGADIPPPSRGQGLSSMGGGRGLGLLGGFGLPGGE